MVINKGRGHLFILSFYGAQPHLALIQLSPIGYCNKNHKIKTNQMQGWKGTPKAHQTSTNSETG